MAEEGFAVRLYVYDLSQGMAKAFSQQLVGIQVDGIWHTGVQVYNYEYFYGGGIQSGLPAQTPYGTPVRVVEMGRTHIPQDVFHEFLREVAPRFAPDKYSLLKWNCNNFSHEVCQFLLSKGIPDFVIGLPDRFIKTPFGQMLKPQFDQMEAQMKSGFGGMPAFEPNLPPVLDEDAIQDVSPPATATVMTADVFFATEHAQHDALERQVNNMLGPESATPSASSTPSAPVSAPSSVQAPAMASRAEPDVSSGTEEKSEMDALMTQLYRSVTHEHRQISLPMVSSREFLCPTVTHDKNLETVAALIIKEIPMDEEAAANIKSLVQYASSSGDRVVDAGCFVTLDRLMNETPPEKLIGLISLWRCVVLYDQAYSYYENGEIARMLVQKLNLGNDEATSDLSMDMTKLVLLLALSHMYCHVREMDENLLDVCLNVFETSNSGNVRLGAARLLFNMAVQSKRESSEVVARMVASLSDRVLRETHAAARFRCLATMSVLMFCNSEVVQFVSELEFDPEEANLSTKRLKQLAIDINALLSLCD